MSCSLSAERARRKNMAQAKKIAAKSRLVEVRNDLAVIRHPPLNLWHRDGQVNRIVHPDALRYIDGTTCRGDRGWNVQASTCSRLSRGGVLSTSTSACSTSRNAIFLHGFWIAVADRQASTPKCMGAAATSSPVTPSTNSPGNKFPAAS